MGNCFGRITSDSEGGEQNQNHQGATQNQRQSRHHRNHHRNLVPGLSNTGSSNSSQDDDDVPLLSGEAGGDDALASGRRQRRRHHRQSGSSSSSSQQGNNHGASSNHLQYFTGATSSSVDPTSLDSNADIKLAQRVGLIQQLPLIRYDEERKQIARECVICMIEFDTGDMLRCLPCLHTFHEQCIDQWLLKSLTCPSCLEPVDAALLATFATDWSN